LAVGSNSSFVVNTKSRSFNTQGVVTWFQDTYPSETDARIAYFSAEFGLHESLPIYSGGLGVLAGDHVKSASDLGVPLVGVGLSVLLLRDSELVGRRLAFGAALIVAGGAVIGATR